MRGPQLHRESRSATRSSVSSSIHKTPQFAANSLTDIKCTGASHPTRARCSRGALRCSDFAVPLTRALEVLTSGLIWLCRLRTTKQRTRLACNDVLQDLCGLSRRSSLQGLEELEVLVLVISILRPPVTCDTTTAVCPPPRELVGFGRTDPRRSWRPFARRPRW